MTDTSLPQTPNPHGYPAPPPTTKVKAEANMTQKMIAAVLIFIAAVGVWMILQNHQTQSKARSEHLGCLAMGYSEAYCSRVAPLS